ncbi:MAG: dihydrofolate reductase family protein [Betaproteobacteria bacterium]|nr:dihydrofolate reductase family protein [Betaproteobacteria bacterium]MDE2124717.1 dihydrofolate reductase family protein [Betaproteobacteria bacterium]MDE2186974.1 dihydrofolate reductase family protein [Betaproteobacteria bacterium]MDE2325898.1 dihydrofolate reductase family protein [Betaproteobacteria bacterium]
MTKLRVQNFAVSLDGYAAGPDQDLQNPLGVHLGGGAATVRQYLQARLIDELHLAVSPVLLGRGEALFAGLDLPALGYACTQVVPGERATHVMLGRRP